jgi:hypothetical protein
VDGYEKEIQDDLEDNEIPGTGLSPTVTNQTTLTPAVEEQAELAQTFFKSAFPNGSIILKTSASHFECALYALQTSMQHQLPSWVTPPIAELRALASTGPVAQRFRDVEGHKVDVDNFNEAHVAATLEKYTRARGYDLQLGIYWNDRNPFVQYAENKSARTLGVYNDDAQSSTTIGHYSGMKAKINR